MGKLLALKQLLSEFDSSAFPFHPEKVRKVRLLGEHKTLLWITLVEQHLVSRKFLKVTVSLTRRLSDLIGWQKTRCFPNEAGIADFQSHPPLISDVSSQNGRREAGRLCLQLISINHRPSGSHLPVSCRGKLSAAGEVLPSLMLPNSECPLCPHQAQPHLSHFCSTFYLSGEHCVLIRPQMAQFLGDHFGKSLGVNFATSMAVKSD